MSISAEVGFEIDLGGKVDKLSDKVQRAMDLMLPIHKPVGNSVYTGGSTPPSPFSLEVSGPSRGRTWEVISFGLYGVDGHTTISGIIADMYAGQVNENLVPDFSGIKYSGMAVGTTYTLGHKHIWVHPEEMLYLLIYGATSAINLTFVANVDEYIVQTHTAQSA
jgi:hypothetical protein